MTDHQPTHANCVALNGRAVLMIGHSGSGKSDLAIRLIDRGWSLVADDYVTLVPVNGRLMATTPANIAGRIEVRDVGLVEVPFVSSVPVCLVIQLDGTPERLPEPQNWRFEDIDIPLLSLHPFEASAPVKVEHSLRVHGLTLD